MINAFKAMFAAFVTFFGAIDKFAKALDHIAGWSEEAAGSMADVARIERQQKVNELMKQSKVTPKQLAEVK